MKYLILAIMMFTMPTIANESEVKPMDPIVLKQELDILVDKFEQLNGRLDELVNSNSTTD